MARIRLKELVHGNAKKKSHYAKKEKQCSQIRTSIKLVFFHREMENMASGSSFSTSQLPYPMKED